MRVRQSVPLLLVLVAVAFGLLGMHTLGHDRLLPGAATSATAAQPAMASASDPMAPLATGDRDPGPGGGHHMPVGEVICLAVVVAAATVTLLLILYGRVRYVAARVIGVVWRAVVAPRGPPPLQMGLRLADAAIMRN